MTTSGTQTFTMTRAQIIESAYRTAGVCGIGQPISNDLYTYANTQLNMLIKHWENLGIHLWTTQYAVIFMNPSKNQYSIGSGGDPAALMSDYGSDTLAANATAAATTITLTDVTDFAVNDYIGVLLNTGYLFWTTITAINTGTKVVTLHDGITSAAATGNMVYCYTTPLDRPLRITRGVFRDKSNFDRSITVYSRNDYLERANKSTSGMVTEIFYDPALEPTGTLYVWQKPQDASGILVVNCRRRLEDLTASNQVTDLPTSWLLAIERTLAGMLCNIRGLYEKKDALDREALIYLKQASDADEEEGVIRISKDPYR